MVSMMMMMMKMMMMMIIIIMMMPCPKKIEKGNVHLQHIKSTGKLRDGTEENSKYKILDGIKSCQWLLALPPFIERI
jgi:hypothetical protein